MRWHWMKLGLFLDMVVKIILKVILRIDEIDADGQVRKCNKRML